MDRRRGRLVERRERARHHVVDVAEVTLHQAHVIELDGRAAMDRLGEDVGRHVGAAPGAVNREIAQARGRQSVHVAVGLDQQLARALGGGIDGDRMVHAVAHREGHLPVATIDRRRRGIEKVLQAAEPAGQLQHDQMTHDVGLDVGVGIEDRLPHTGHRRQMHDAVDAGMGVGQRQRRLALRNIGLQEGEVFGFAQRLQAGEFQDRVVVGVEIVEPHHLFAPRQQGMRDLAADEAGDTGDQDGHGMNTS